MVKLIVLKFCIVPLILRLGLFLWKKGCIHCFLYESQTQTLKILIFSFYFPEILKVPLPGILCSSFD